MLLQLVTLSVLLGVSGAARARVEAAGAARPPVEPAARVPFDAAGPALARVEAAAPGLLDVHVAQCGPYYCVEIETAHASVSNLERIFAAKTSTLTLIDKRNGHRIKYFCKSLTLDFSDPYATCELESSMRTLLVDTKRTEMRVM